MTLNIEHLDNDSFNKNLDKYVELVSWARFFPDLWWDLITPPTGGIRLDLDQRVFLRSIARFLSTYGVFPRGYGKTYCEVLAMFHASVWFPDITIAMTAQTEKNAAKILKEKYNEIIIHYPLILKEISGKPSFSKDSAEIKFKSGGVIDVLANHQNSKGSRRKRLQIEESVLLNDALFMDALEPIPNIPRRTIGKDSLINPEELNGQINFYSTSSYRQTSEFDRNIRMLDEMAELKGKIVIGAGWELAVHYERGETKSKILEKKANNSPSSFATNYESKWIGLTSGGIVDIAKVMDLRTIPNHEEKGDGKSFYLLSIDVARSQNKAANQTSIAVLKLKENAIGRILKIQLVNLINLPNKLNFTNQAIEIKRIKNNYKSQCVVFDNNGLGVGLKDELLKEHIDPLTNENLGCWDTINTDDVPELQNAEKILYALVASGINSDIIVAFMGAIENGKLQLLTKKQDSAYDYDDAEAYKSIVPHLQTDLFIEEVANLRLVTSSTGKLTIEKVSSRIDKDRYSAVAMGLWYIKTFLDKIKEDQNINPMDFMLIRTPSFDHEF